MPNESFEMTMWFVYEREKGGEGEKEKKMMRRLTGEKGGGRGRVREGVWGREGESCICGATLGPASCSTTQHERWW
jgi:hypothetical protein